MSSTADSTLLSTLPARALLGRLLAVRISMIAGWAVGMVWLHWGLGIALPLLPMGAVLILMGMFSFTTAWRLRLDLPATPMEFLAHLLADLTAFAVLVFFSGGVTNPFVSLMLVPIVIAAISLRPRWVWLLAAIAGGFYGLLLFHFQPLAVADPIAAYGMHLGGMWFNFLVSAGLIAFFVTRMHAALRTRDQELSTLREKQLRDERIVALGTQAALAAHELATPLATIQTTAHELAREFANDPDIGDDCRLLEKQAQACKRILTQLAARARDGNPAAQPHDAWLATLVERWQVLRPDAHLTFAPLHDHREFSPPEGLEQAIMNVLNNAADASPDAVGLEASADQKTLTLDIMDRGHGFSPNKKRRRDASYSAAKPAGAWAWRSLTPPWSARGARSPWPNATAAAAAYASPCPGNKPMKMKLLIVEDDADFAAALARAMKKRGIEVALAHDAIEARAVAAAFAPSHAVVDLKLPGESGLAVVAALAARTPPPAMVVLTGYASIATAVEAVRLGARHYLAKPADADEILAALMRDQPDAALEVSAEPLSVARLEWEHIQKVLNEYDGNISATARALKMHRRTLQRKLDKNPPKAG